MPQIIMILINLDKGDIIKDSENLRDSTFDLRLWAEKINHLLRLQLQFNSLSFLFFFLCLIL